MSLAQAKEQSSTSKDFGIREGTERHRCNSSPIEKTNLKTFPKGLFFLHFRTVLPPCFVLGRRTSLFYGNYYWGCHSLCLHFLSGFGRHHRTTRCHQMSTRRRRRVHSRRR